MNAAEFDELPDEFDFVCIGNEDHELYHTKKTANGFHLIQESKGEIVNEFDMSVNGLKTSLVGSLYRVFDNTPLPLIDETEWGELIGG